MKYAKSIAVLTALYLSSGIPGLLKQFGYFSEYSPLFQMLMVFHLLSCVLVFVGAFMLFKSRFNIALGLIYIGCFVASIGIIQGVFSLFYPLPWSFHLSYFFGESSGLSGYGIQIQMPLIVLAVLLSAFSKKKFDDQSSIP